MGVSMKEGEDFDIGVASALNKHDRKAVVQINIPQIQFDVVITPRQARDLSGLLLKAAEESESDEFLIAWADHMSDGQLTDGHIEAIMSDRAEYRQRYGKKDGKSTTGQAPFPVQACHKGGSA